MKMLLLSLFCLSVGVALAKIDYHNYHAIVAGPLRTQADLRVIDLLRDEDSRSRKVTRTGFPKHPIISEKYFIADKNVSFNIIQTQRL